MLQATITYTLYQNGDDVHLDATGTLNFDANSDYPLISMSCISDDGTMRGGPLCVGEDFSASTLLFFLTGPSTTGSVLGTNVEPDVSDGLTSGIIPGSQSYIIDRSYISGQSYDASAIWLNTTLQELGFRSPSLRTWNVLNSFVSFGVIMDTIELEIIFVSTKKQAVFSIRRPGRAHCETKYDRRGLSCPRGPPCIQSPVVSRSLSVILCLCDDSFYATFLPYGRKQSNPR